MDAPSWLDAGPTERTRDGACTPKWLADALGLFTYDPCSNVRSHINAVVRFDGSPGKDGLARRVYDDKDTFFVNPPYSRGQVAKWVEAFKRRNTVFLLRWDPSTAWWRDLITWCDLVWFASKRIEFEPPPGVTFSSNPYPHALYLTFDAAERLRHSRLTSLGTFMRPV